MKHIFLIYLITQNAIMFITENGGRSSGKSYFLVDKLVIKGINDKRRMLFMMKQDNKVEDTVWAMLISTLHKFKLYDFCKVNKSSHTVEFPNGTWIKCMGLSVDSERIKGQVDITDVWMEECTSFTEEDCELVDGTMRGKALNKQMYFSFNPVSMQNWVYKYFHFDTGKFDDDTFILKTTYKDNKWCDDGTIKRLEKLKERNPARYKIEAEGDFATLDKLVYTNWRKEEFDPIALLRNCDGKELVAIHSLDFGYISDETALVSMIADTVNMKLYIYDEHYQKAMLTKDIADMLKSKGLHKTNVICDRQEARLIDELNKLGCKCKKCQKGRGSIMAGITKIQEFDMIVHPKCKNYITELENYCYQKDKSTGEYINKPIDSWNHLMDATRYGIFTLKKKAKILDVGL